MGTLYTKLKIFKHKERLDALGSHLPTILPPIHVRVKPTNICNHNCDYCAYRVSHMQLGQDMNVKESLPKEKMFEVVDDFQSMGVKAITFSGGGEPFCYPHFKETIVKLINTDIKFSALTNGSRLRGELAELFSHHATWIRVSMDGFDDQSYRDYRGVALGEFSKIMTNLESFSRIGGDCSLGVVIVVDKRNASHIYNLSKRIRDIGLSSVKIAPCIVSNDGKSTNEYHSSIFDLVREQVQLVISELSSRDFEVFDSYHTQLESFEKDYSYCPSLQLNPVIGADGIVYTCHDKAYNLKTGVLGNIKQQSFFEMWNKDKRRFFGLNPSKSCNHHCVADGQNKMLLEYIGIDDGHSDFV
ncbi:MAG: radical SAM protein [Deltaproteobacteria bacterium]|nr:radical SAM protein [Deltaproteobacteria bacterium]